MTADEFVALPRSRTVRRRLLDGQLIEWDWYPRDRWHAATIPNLLVELNRWADELRPPIYAEVSGFPVVTTDRKPASAVDVDVCVTVSDRPIPFDGPSAAALAVEVIDTCDTPEQIADTVRVCLEDGIPLVWLIHPREETVTAYRLGAEPVLFNAAQELDGGDVLPGFRCPVARLFE